MNSNCADKQTVPHMAADPVPMPDSPLPRSPAPQSPRLSELQAMLEQEIPVCAQMGIRVHHQGQNGLVMRLPLVQNRNHQQTAFAGSLNALCTVAGWGTVFLLLKELGQTGNIVIRRSTIRYQQPVDSSDIFAHCLPISARARKFFVEMMEEKGQAKLDVGVEIPGTDRPAVVFQGSYVVLKAHLPTSAPKGGS